MKSNAIIFVESNEAFRKIVVAHLRQEYFVKEFDHTAVALQYMLHHPAHLVLFSVSPEKLPPAGFIKEVRNSVKLKHLPIVTLLHRQYWELQHECYDAGADVCLEKPFGLEVLNAVIKAAMRNREAAFLFAKRKTLLPQEFINIEAEDEFFMQRLNRFIRGQVSNVEVSVSGMAEAMSLSVSQLDRRVSRLAGCSPKQYIRDYRMKVAFELLAEKRGNVTEVAMLTGFRSVSYFSTKFREHFGATPSKFRIPKLLGPLPEDDYPPRVA
jgi:AraC-like DNA-binding protein